MSTSERVIVHSGVTSTLLVSQTYTYCSGYFNGNGGMVEVQGGGTLNTNGANFKNTSAQKGGAIYNNSGTTNISGGDFNGNYATEKSYPYGGAIYNQNGEVNISSANFTGNGVSSNGKGGVIYNNNGTVNAFSANFIGNSATYGAVAYVQRGSATFLDCNFTGNIDGVTNGGAIYTNSGALVISGCHFDGNKVTGKGGAVFSVKAVTANVIGGTFVGNSAGAEGGAIYNSAGSANISGMDFIDNSASSGGAIYNSNGTVNISGANFSGNSAIDGGAICNASGTVNISGANFSGNNAHSSGGAICNDSGTVNISGANFSGNNAFMAGAIYNKCSGTVNVFGGNFNNNSAVRHGGAIYNSSGTVNIFGGSFVGNSTGSNYQGGAIMNASGCTINISGVSFEDNGASVGGAMQNMVNVSATIDDCSFKGNSASRDGGAISNNNTIMTISGGSFVDNAGKNGGAISIAKGKVNISGVNFSGNSASNSGGAIYNYNSAILDIFGANFSGNSANEGGAIFNLYGGLNISGATFSGNSAKLFGAIQNFKGTATLKDVSTLTSTDTIKNSGEMTFKGTISLAATLTTTTTIAATGATVVFDVTSYGSALNTALLDYSMISGATYGISINANQVGDYTLASNAAAAAGTISVKFAGTSDSISLTVGAADPVVFGDNNYSLYIDNNGTEETTDDDKLVLTVKQNKPFIGYELSESIDTTYNGQAQSITVSVTDPVAGATVYYSVDGKQTWTEGDSYSLTNATAETVTVYFKLEAEDYATTITDARTIDIGKREITLVSGDATKPRDGEPLKKEEVTALNVVSGEGFDYSNFASQTEVGSTANTFEYNAQDGTNANNYDITIVEGSLIVTNGEADVKADIDSLTIPNTQEQEVVCFNVTSDDSDAKVKNESAVDVSVGKVIAAGKATVENDGAGNVNVLDVVGKDVDIINHGAGKLEVFDQVVAAGNLNITNDEVEGGSIVLYGEENQVAGELSITNDAGKTINGGFDGETEKAAKITVTGSDSVTISNEGHLNMNLSATKSTVNITNGAPLTLIGEYTGKTVKVTNESNGVAKDVILTAVGNSGSFDNPDFTLTGAEGSLFQGDNEIIVSGEGEKSQVKFVGTNTFTGTLTVDAKYITNPDAIIRLTDVDATFNNVVMFGPTVEISGISKVSTAAIANVILKDGVVLSTLQSAYEFTTIEGSATLKDGAIITLKGSQTIASDKTVTVTGQDTLLQVKSGNTLTNNGTINVVEKAGIVSLGTIINNGILNLSKGGQTDGGWTNNGTINLKGGDDYTVINALTNNGTLNWELSKDDKKVGRVLWAALTNTQSGKLVITVAADDVLGDSYVIAQNASGATGAFTLTGIGDTETTISIGGEATYNGFFYTLKVDNDYLIFKADRCANPKVEVTTEEKWFNANDTITIEGTVVDYIGEGIKSLVVTGDGIVEDITASIKDGAWSYTYTGEDTAGLELTISATDGNDGVGTATYMLKVDTVKPEIAFDAETTELKDSVTFTATATDGNSVTKLEYSTDNGANWTEVEITAGASVQAELTVSANHTTYLFRATDQAGNVGEKSVTFDNIYDGSEDPFEIIGEKVIPAGAELNFGVLSMKGNSKLTNNGSVNANELQITGSKNIIDGNEISAKKIDLSEESELDISKDQFDAFMAGSEFVSEAGKLVVSSSAGNELRTRDIEAVMGKANLRNVDFQEDLVAIKDLKIQGSKETTISFLNGKGTTQNDTIRFYKDTNITFGSEGGVIDLQAGNNLVQIDKNAKVTINSDLANVSTVKSAAGSKVEIGDITFQAGRNATLSAEGNSFQAGDIIGATNNANTITIGKDTEFASGAILFGGRNDTITANKDSKVVVGSSSESTGARIDFGAGNDQLNASGELFVAGAIDFGAGNDKLTVGAEGKFFAAESWIGDLDDPENLKMTAADILFGDGNDTLTTGKSSFFAAGNVTGAETITLGAYSKTATGDITGVRNLTMTVGSSKTGGASLWAGDVTGTTENDIFDFDSYNKAELGGLDFGKGNDTMKLGTNTRVDITGALDFGAGNDKLSLAKGAVLNVAEFNVDSLEAGKLTMGKDAYLVISDADDLAAAKNKWSKYSSQIVSQLA